MDFKTAVKTCVKQKYACFDGRATRSEYWYFILFYIACYILSDIIGGIISNNAAMLLNCLVMLGLLLPNIGVLVRRLHDINKSGWLALIMIVPLINLLLIYWCCQKSTPEANRFGEMPI